MEMTHYQSLLLSLVVVLQVLAITYSCTEKEFWIFATGCTTLCLLALFVSTLGV